MPRMTDKRFEELKKRREGIRRAEGLAFGVGVQLICELIDEVEAQRRELKDLKGFGAGGWATTD